MKKMMLMALMAVVVASLVLVSVAQQAQQGGQQAQQGGQRRGGGMGGGGMNFQQMREAQEKAMTGLVENIAKLKTMQEANAAAMQNREQFQNMSEEERTKMRETMMKQREEQTKLFEAMELQMLTLRGVRQVMTEHRAAVEELTAIRDQATQENAPKTAEMITKMMETKQAAYDALLKSLGIERPQQPPQPQQ